MRRPHGSFLLDLVRTDAPAEPLVSLEVAKRQLDVEHDEDDANIAVLITAVTDHLDGYAGVLGRALVAQTWRLCLRHFPFGRFSRLELPLPPLISVTSIHYVDTAGVDQLVDPADYQVIDGPKAAVEPVWGKFWPPVRRQARAVTVKYVCGYGAAAAVPGPFVQAALLLLGELYRNKEAALVDAGAFLENPALQRLTRPLRVPRI